MPVNHRSVEVDMPPGGFVSTNASVPEKIEVRYNAELGLIIANIDRAMLAMSPQQWALFIDAVNEVTPQEALA